MSIEVKQSAVTYYGVAAKESTNFFFPNHHHHRRPHNHKHHRFDFVFNNNDGQKGLSPKIKNLFRAPKQKGLRMKTLTWPLLANY